MAEITGTLADEFLADLADAGEETEEVKQETFDIAEDFAGTKDDEKDEDEMEISPNIKEAKDLLQVLYSERLKKLQQRITDIQSIASSKKVSGPAQEDEEYQLVVDSNAMTLELNNEVMRLHKFIKSIYAKKFPELESLVLNPLDYARVVVRIGNEMDLTKVDFADILPSATVMVVTVAATTTSGSALPSEDLDRVREGCRYMLEIDEERKKVVDYVEGRMNVIAPNLSAMVGTAIAAKLMSAAGGLRALAQLPSNNMLSMGSNKRNLSAAATGMSSASIKTRAGFIYDSEIVQRTPPAYKLAAVRLMAGKCTLAARVDSCNQDKTGGIGRAFREQVERKLEKAQEPPPMKLPKPLPAPDDKPKKRRGGKRMRKIKEKYELTDMRKAANRISFGTEAQETIRDTDQGLGMLGVSGTGKIRMAAQDKGILKKQKITGRFAKSGTTSGISSSLAFTPLQGMEFKVADDQKIKEANEKYFGISSFKKP
eukprot:TRINITY_DN5215_c0_g1_i1.p1 TRINITY_DN5215_c0_g1~~TRINITY_DN5215_c0_g1_i1.p1  ORF type:complete len:485 (-),score=145.89 TRINITY_DN5215_c0_g1_i1:26-1480(-)